MVLPASPQTQGHSAVGGSLISVPSFFLFLAVVLGMTLSVTFFVRGGNRPANRTLGALALCVSLIVLHYTLLWTRTMTAFPHLIGMVWPLWFLIGPLYYLYTGYLMGPARPDLRHAVHFFPALLSLGYNLPYYRVPAEVKLGDMERMLTPNHPLEAGMLTVLMLRLFHMGFYVFLSSSELRRFTGEYKHHSSGDEITRLELFRWVTVPFVTYLALCAGGMIFLYLFEESRGWVDFLHIMALTAFAVALCLVGLRQNEFVSSEVDSPEKYRKAHMTDAQVQANIAELKRVMETERLYLRGDLRLYHLASSLGVSTHNLSQLLNQSLNTNFYDFVNFYRVEHAKQRLSDPESREYTLVSVAHEVGFSSKASFNRAFKKLAGMTPSQFQVHAIADDDPSGDTVAL